MCDQTSPVPLEAWRAPEERTKFCLNLKAIGILIKFLQLLLLIQIFLTQYVSEKKVLPVVVVIAFIVYFSIAASSYYQ